MPGLRLSSAAPLPVEIRELLESSHVLHLATGSGCSAPLFFAVLDGGLVWISDVASEHSRNLVRDPVAAASIAPSAPPLDGFTGLQLRGRWCPDVPQDRLRGAWLARFPAAAALVANRPGHRFWFLQLEWARRIERSGGRNLRTEWSA